MGAGGISGRVARGIIESDNCELVFAASRDIDKAKALAEKYQITDYGDYEKLFKADIDGVYIAVIDRYHYPQIKRCLENGKHVICEKPMLIKEKEITELYELANSRNLLLLEAMKCRYLPTIDKVRELLAGRIKPTLLTATFCRNEIDGFSENSFFYDKEYGGALKSVGCYVLSWALDLFPQKIIDRELKEVCKDGVDTESWLKLKNKDGMTMDLGCSVTFDFVNQACISGEGYLIRAFDFWKSYHIEVWEDDVLTAEYQEDIGSEFRYQVDFFGDTIKKAQQLSVNEREEIFLKEIASYYPTSR